MEEGCRLWEWERRVEVTAMEVLQLEDGERETPRSEEAGGGHHAGPLIFGKTI